MGMLNSVGIPEYEAKHYEQHIKDGGAFLCVHVDDASSAEKAKQILASTQAQDVNVSGEIKNNETAIHSRP